MTPYALIAIVLSIALLVGFFNAKILKLQTSIAMMLSAMVIAACLLLLKAAGAPVLTPEHLQIITRIHFSHLLLDCFLAFLLFAGSLTIDFDAMKEQKWAIGILATFTTLASTALVACVTHLLLNILGIPIPWIYACLFGALISPTDPIAVLATFKRLGAPGFLKAAVAGESLFNDGVGIVIFTTLLVLLTGGHTPDVGDVLLLFVQQALGGVGYGIALGIVSLWLCRQTQDSKLQLLTTLAIVTGGYTFALSLDISGPLAMVVCGIWLGNGLRKTAHFHFLETIWEAIDEVLNTILFLLIGFEMLDFSMPAHIAWLSLFVIPMVLIIRLITVAIPVQFISRKNRKPGFVRLLTWGGLRGGLAIALALSLPDGESRDIVLTLTYWVVAFSVIIQGITIKPLVKKFYPGPKKTQAH